MEKMKFTILIILLLATVMNLYNAIYGVKLNREYKDAVYELNFVINEYEMMIESTKRIGGMME